jgi:hypothetical protein
MWFHDLIAHKGYADAELLTAVRRHVAAPSDPDLRTLLHQAWYRIASGCFLL